MLAKMGSSVRCRHLPQLSVHMCPHGSRPLQGALHSHGWSASTPAWPQNALRVWPQRGKVTSTLVWQITFSGVLALQL
jgi:hypothetical protein